MYSSTIVGYVHGYGIEACWNWAKSLKAHYTGDVVVIASNITKETHDWFTFLGFTVYTHTSDPKIHPVVTRFLYLWKLIEMGKIKTDFVMMSDVKDVVFQGDLNRWFATRVNEYGVYVGSENVIYENEPWGNQNLITSFPYEYERLKVYEIFNAGTFSAELLTMADLCKLIYLLSVHNPIHNPDQAALNVLLRTHNSFVSPQIQTVHDDYAIQIGTTFDPTKNLKQILSLDGIGWDENGIVSRKEIPYYIVHQYDRQSNLRQLIDKRYK